MTKIFLKKRNYEAFVKLENKDKLSIELKDLEFSVRAMNSLSNQGIKTLGELIVYTENDLKSFPNMGRTSIEEIKRNKWGGLLVFERENSLKNVVSDAVPMHASFSPELLVSIFNPSSPLHDGAVVIHNNLIEAAACILPLTESKTLNPEMGTRHRAALGISEESDALAVVISEESGKISVAENGYFISSGLSLDELGKILKEKMNEFIEQN